MPLPRYNPPMADDAKTGSRWLPRALVAGTIMVCLGVGGFVAQSWWAKQVSEDVLTLAWNMNQAGPRFYSPKVHLKHWRAMPLWGRFGTFPLPTAGTQSRFAFGSDRLWAPRRTYYEMFKSLTGEDLGNDPSAWEAWLNAHPNLVWDEKRKRLVDASPKP